MTITITSLGTAQNKTLNGRVQMLSNLTLSQNDEIIVSVAGDLANKGIDLSRPGNIVASLNLDTTTFGQNQYSSSSFTVATSGYVYSAARIGGLDALDYLFKYSIYNADANGAPTGSPLGQTEEFKVNGAVALTLCAHPFLEPIYLLSGSTYVLVANEINGNYWNTGSGGLNGVNKSYISPDGVNWTLAPTAVFSFAIFDSFVLSLDEAAFANNSGNVAVNINSHRVPESASDYRIFANNSATSATAIAAYKVSGLINDSFDTSSTGTGTGASPSSGASGTLAQDYELVIGVIGIEDNVEDIAGSWTTGTGNVSGNEQQGGTSGGGGASNIVIRTAAEVVNATTAQTAAITSTAGGDWAALVATFKGNYTPTVELNTPTEGQDITDNTPDLTFTGTDVEGQSLEYQVQVDTSGSFAYLSEQLASTVGQVIGGGTAGSGESAQANGQTFVATKNALLTSIDLRLYRTGSPTDYVVVTIHSGSETGTTLGTSGQLSAIGLTTSDVGEVRNFAFTPSITLTQNTTYYIVIERTGTRNITDAPVIRTTTSNVYSSGTWRRRDNNTWSDQTGDIYFKLYSTYPIDAFSSSGIGFSGTHPFTSGSSVTYTAGKRDFNSYQAGDNLSYGLDNQVRYRGQSFHGMDGKIVSTGAWLKKDASGGSTSVKMSLWSHSGTFGSTGMPSSRLATSTTSIPVGDLSSSLTYYEFYFTGSDAITLTSGSNYCAVVELVNYGGSDAITIAMATSASRHAGNAASSTSGTGWTTYSNYDLDFTVLVGLPESTTYYWRVRGNDGAEWGDWTSPRSFDLTSGSSSGVSVTPTAVSTVTDRVNPTVRYGSISVAPAVLSAVSATVNPTVQLGSVSKIPPVVDSAASIGTLTVVHGSLAIPISALATASSVIAPSVVLGSLSLSNLLSSSTASVINPTVTIGTGNVTAEPSAVSTVASQVNPTVQLGSVDVVPANQPQTVAVSINPQYSAGSLSLQPTPLEAISAALYSDVVAGSLLLAPAAVISATATVIEAVSYGAISVEPASLQAGTAVYLEAIHLGSLSFSDLLSSVPVETVNPTVNITSGNISITPEAVASVAVSLSPQSIYGSCLVTLQPVLAATESLCQAVQYGALSIVPTSTYLVAGSMLGAVSLGSVLVAVAPLDTKAETTQALVIQSSLVLPLPVASAASQSLATATNGSLSIQPSPLDLVSTSVDPLVELGPLSIGLYAVSSRTEHIAPTVVLASLSISLPDATTSSSTILPSLVLGPLVIPPQSVFCSVTIIVPEILFSSTGISGAIASTMAVAVNPDIPMGSVWYTPPPVTVGSISLNPSTFAGNQFCRPIADSSNSGWLNELGLSTNLYESINETTPSDTDYITTPISVLESHTITENLQVIEDPEVHVLHKMRFRYKTVGSVENGFYVQLSQVGVGTIATWSIASANDMYETVEIELTEEEAAAITDYSALQVSFYNGTQP